MLPRSLKVAFAALLLSSPLVCSSVAALAADYDAYPVGTTGKKIKINYQSGRRGQSRFYSVRNTAKGLLTEVLWSGRGETFIDCTLPKCPGEEPSTWVIAVIPTTDMAKGKTKLGYGANADQYEDEPEAFVRAAGKSDAGAGKMKAPPLRTSFIGDIADSQKKTISVSMIVESVALPGQDDTFVLQYRITNARGKETPLALNDEDRKALHPVLVWESASTKKCI
jgi:hypothetical protein